MSNDALKAIVAASVFVVALFALPLMAVLASIWFEWCVSIGDDAIRKMKERQRIKRLNRDTKRHFPEL
jgi:hypothetical protein